MNLSKSKYGAVEYATGCTKKEWGRMKYIVNRDDGDVLTFSNGYTLRSNHDEQSPLAGDFLCDRHGNLIQYSRAITFMRYWSSGLLWNESFTWGSKEIPALSEYMYDTPDFSNNREEMLYSRIKATCTANEVYYVPLYITRVWDYEEDERGELVRQDTYRTYFQFNTIYYNFDAFNIRNGNVAHVVTRHAPSELKRQFAIELHHSLSDSLEDDDERAVILELRGDMTLSDLQEYVKNAVNVSFEGDAMRPRYIAIEIATAMELVNKFYQQVSAIPDMAL